MNKLKIGWFLKGFALVGILLLLSFAVYGVGQSLAQSEGNTNPTGEVVNDALNTETGGLIAAASPGEEDNGPNVQDGGESLLLDDNPGTVFDDAPAYDTSQPTSNIASEVVESDVFGIESINATPYAVVIPAADFSNDGVDPTGPFFSFAEGAWNGHLSSTCMMAPAYLPNGVTIAEFWGTFGDTDASYTGEMRLFRKFNYSTAVSEQMASVSSGYAFSGGLINPGDTTIDYPVVDSPNYSYFVGGCLGSSLIEFVGVRIYYWP